MRKGFRIIIINKETEQEIVRDYEKEFFEKDPEAVGSFIQEMYDAIK